MNESATGQAPGGIATDEPKSLFNLAGESIDINFVDERDPLFLPNNPLHWKAHKLDVLLKRLDKMAANSKNANSFNAQSYLQILNAYIAVCEQIKTGAASDEDGDASRMAENGDEDGASEVGERKPVGVGARVSPDNPFAR